MTEGPYDLINPSAAEWTIGQVWRAWCTTAHM